METNWKSAKDLLNFLNKEYLKLHQEYEKYFWVSYMGDKTANIKKDKAQNKRDNFRSNKKYLKDVTFWQNKSKGEIKQRLSYWVEFFSKYQVPDEVSDLRDKIAELETKIETIRSTRKEGYIDPYKNKFVKISRNGMRSIMTTNDDEKIRKACFDSLEKISTVCVSKYRELVNLRNKFAKLLGYKDFYEYKLLLEEKMTKKDLFDLFDNIYDKTKYAYLNIRKLEKNKPGLRKPWNFGYMMSGSFVKEADPYFPFEKSVPLWIETFSRLGINFRKGRIVLDLLDREGKYNNGFCHWPTPVSYNGSIRMPATAQFTCTVVPGIPGQSVMGLNTLFHEGGHAAHLLNCDNKDICMNTEYPPASTAWDETQSMFLDTICSSIEWRTRYAKNKNDQPYPLDLFIRQSKALHPLRPLDMSSINMVINFEKDIYESKDLTEEKIKLIAKKNYKKYTDRSEDSMLLLDVPHIYSWESACSYHGYGLAELALSQWRSYFFKKYGYIVDNPNIGKEMQKVWKLGSIKSFPDIVKLATGKKLSSKDYLDNVTISLPKLHNLAKKRINDLAKVKQKQLKGNELNVLIELVHGKKKIANSKSGYKVMTDKYEKWLKTQYSSKIG